MKKALVLLLVLVVVVTGIPVVMGMSTMAACPDCGPALAVGTACAVAILAACVTLLFALLAGRLGGRRDALSSLLHSFLLERPPRLV